MEMDAQIREAFEYGKWYMDGSLYVVIVTGDPSSPAYIGIGDTPEEAAQSLERTPIQCCGIRYVRSALNWACGAGWISEPCDLYEIDNPVLED